MLITSQAIARWHDPSDPQVIVIPTLKKDINMRELTHDLEQISGGFSAYDVGYGIGSAFRSAALGLAYMGRDYTPIL
jgi:hypothetical protein